MLPGSDEHVEGLRNVAKAGSDAIYIHNINREQG